MSKRVPKGTDPNGIIFEKEYHWGLSPLVLFCSFHEGFYFIGMVGDDVFS